MNITRRQVVISAAAAASSLAFDTGLFAAESGDSSLPALGAMPTRASKDIAASGLSVGFETLDRKHFDPTKCYAHVGELGVKWARCQTGWCRCEPEKGRYDFAWLDEVVDSLGKVGVQAWFNLGYGNPIYTPKADATAVGWAPVFDPVAREGWLAFVDKLAEHSAGRVRHWELWNEPNITNFWKPGKPDAAAYVDLVKMTAPVIRKRVANSFLIGGVLAGMPLDYLKKCMDAGLGDHVDAISYHPYRNTPETNYAKEVAAFRALLDKHKPGLKLWQGENGAPSKKGGAGALAGADWDETRQAKWLTRRIVYDLALGVDLTSYFLIVDLVGYRGSTNWKGLLRGDDYSRKPSFVAYQRLCALFDAKTTRCEEAKIEVDGVDSKNLKTHLFARDGRALCAIWDAADLFQPLQPGKATLRITLPPGVKLDEPALADPLTGKVVKAEMKRTDTGVTITGVPVMDHAMLVGDAAILVA